MNNLLFKLRYVFRNVTRNPFRTLSLLLSLTMLAFVLLTTFSVKGALVDGFEIFEDVRNERIDVVVNFDANSTSHIFNPSQLNRLSEYIEYYTSTFEIPSYAEISDKGQNVTLMAANSEEISPFVNENIQYLKYNECILAADVAKGLNASIGSIVELSIMDKKYQYNVVKIINATSIVTNSSIIIQKDYFLKDYIKKNFNFDLSYISNINLATNIYINLNDNVNREAFINFINSPTYYKGAVVRDPRIINQFHANIKLVVGVLYAALIIFASALFFVLLSIVDLRVRNFKNEVGAIETLGEKKTYMFDVLGLEIFILSLIALVLAYLLNTFIYTKEFDIISVKGKFIYNYKWWQFALTLLVIFIACGYTLIICYRKYKKIETIQLANDKSYDEVMSVKSLIIVNAIVGGIWALDFFVFYRIFPLVVSGVIGITATLVFGILFVSLVLKILCRILKTNELFQKTFLNNLKINKIKHNSIKILLVCLFCVVVCFLCIETIEREISRVEDNLNIDYIMVSPTGVNDEMIKKLEDSPNVSSAVPGYLDVNLSTTDNKHCIIMSFSCDINRTKDLMNFTIDEKYQSEFMNPNKRYIVLMNEYLISTGYNVGDTIELALSNGPVKYEILCGANLPFQHFVYTNEFYYKGSSPKTVILDNDMNNKESLEEFKNMVSDEFGSDLCYLFEASNDIRTFFTRVRVALKIVYAVIVVIIICFLVSIINNTILNFQEIKTELATLQILGITPKMTYKLFIEEMLISYAAIMLPIVFMLFSVFRFFGGFSLIFGYFVELSCSFKSMALGLGIGIVCFAVSYIYYFIGFKKIHICEEIKK